MEDCIPDTFTFTTRVLSYAVLSLRVSSFSISMVQGILILDQDGERVFAKYYDPPENLSTPKGQKDFEITLHKKTNDANAGERQRVKLLLDGYCGRFCG